MRKINAISIGIVVLFLSMSGIISFNMLLNLTLQDSLATIILGAGISFITILVFFKIEKLNEDGIVLLNKSLFTKTSWLVNALMIILVLLNTAFLLSYLANYINVWYLHRTNIIVTFLGIVFVSIYLFKNGSGTLFRSINMLFYLLCFFFLIFIIGLFDKPEMLNLLPIFESNNIFVSSILYSLFSSSLIFLILIVPKTKIVDIKFLKKHILLFFVIGQVLVLALMYGIITSIKPELALNYQNPEYMVFAKISFFASIEKLESIIALGMILVLFVNFSFSFYFINEATTTLLKINDKKKIVVTLSLSVILIFIAIFLIKNIKDLVMYFYPFLVLSIFAFFVNVFIRGLLRRLLNV